MRHSCWDYQVSKNPGGCGSNRSEFFEHQPNTGIAKEAAHFTTMTDFPQPSPFNMPPEDQRRDNLWAAPQGNLSPGFQAPAEGAPMQPAGVTPPPGFQAPAGDVPPAPPGYSYVGAQNARADESKRVLAGVLALLFGALGVHKFILGYNKAGFITLAVTLLTCGVGGVVMSFIGIVEGIIYLTKTEEDFVRTYQTENKEWF
jgi:TM2 domain-containing membrane protein YozV